MPLSHVLMWTEEHGYRRVTPDEATLLYPEKVSARSGLFICEICKERVTFTAEGRQARHFRHDSAALNKKHPHVRGEDPSRSSSRAAKGETPPRAWGRLLAFRFGIRHSGNTPTCVGKTVAVAAHVGIGRKHPHVRGEDGMLLPGTPSNRETPPRAWGRPT